MSLRERTQALVGAGMVVGGGIIAGLPFVPVLRGASIDGVLHSGNAFWIVVGLATMLAGALNMPRKKT